MRRAVPRNPSEPKNSMQRFASEWLGLNPQQTQSLILAVVVLCVIVLPQYAWSGGSVDPKEVEAAAARHRARGKLAAVKLRHVLQKSAAAFGHRKAE